jgi:hypothetical protein
MPSATPVSNQLPTACSRIERGAPRRVRWRWSMSSGPQRSQRAPPPVFYARLATMATAIKATWLRRTVIGVCSVIPVLVAYESRPRHAPSQ